MAIGKEAKRLQRARGPPDRLNVWTGDSLNLIYAASVGIIDTEKPATIEEALNNIDSKLWQEAIQSEYNSLKQNKTCDLADLPAGKNIIGSKWVFKHNRGADGQIQGCKACLVAQGYSQKSGVDYDEVFHLWRSIAQFVLCYQFLINFI